MNGNCACAIFESHSTSALPAAHIISTNAQEISIQTTVFSSLFYNESYVHRRFVVRILAKHGNISKPSRFFLTKNGISYAFALLITLNYYSLYSKLTKLTYTKTLKLTSRDKKRLNFSCS